MLAVYMGPHKINRIIGSVSTTGMRDIEKQGASWVHTEVSPATKYAQYLHASSNQMTKSMA